MKGILKPVFEFFIDGFTFFNNPLYNIAAAAIVGAIAYAVAWSFVGFLYNNNMITGRSVGSIIHWTVRAIVFSLIFLIYATIVNLVLFIASVPLWVWLSIAALILLAGAVILLYRKKNHLAR